MGNLESILLNRTDCITYQAIPRPSSEEGTGWIGGNAPA